MPDRMTPEQRRRCMRAVKGKNTRSELIVRKFLFSKGLRYRVNVSRLPGTPDIVMRKYKTVIFIDGCFWHGHKDCNNYRPPQSNEDFWRRKVNMNMARDYRVSVELRLMGWRVIRLWECMLKPASRRAATLSALYESITGQEAAATESKPYADIDAEPAAVIAAEPLTPYRRVRRK